jgi:hydrogenase nickel insertion protein HypA
LHELQLASELLSAVREAIEDRNDVIRVQEVDVMIGSLSFASGEQIAFCWEVLTEEDPLIGGSTLNILTEEGVIRCRECGYTGKLSVREDPSFHYFLPVFACPRCGGSVDMIKGKEVKITNVRLQIDDSGGPD